VRKLGKKQYWYCPYCFTIFPRKPQPRNKCSHCDAEVGENGWVKPGKIVDGKKDDGNRL
jgi:hypothetical protein